MKRLLSVLLTFGTTAAFAQQAPTFAIGDVVMQVVPQERVLDGTVEAVNRTTVSAQTAGEVIEVLYDVDDYVKQKDVLVRIKARSQSASKKQAQAGLAEAQARLKQAKQEFTRVENIYERQLVSKSKLDDATAELNSARARLASARAGLNKADEQLGNTQVRAPYSGIVIERHVDVGEFVSVGQKLMTGVSLEELRINVDVPQKLVNTLRKFKIARLLMSDLDVDAISASDLTIFPYADPVTNTFRVRVNLENSVEGLFPGMFVKVAFTTGQSEQLVVPQEAVAYRSEVTGVYVMDENNHPHFRYVRVGQPVGDGANIVVLAGLSEADKVALDPIAAGIYLKRYADSKGEGDHE